MRPKSKLLQKGRRTVANVTKPSLIPHKCGCSRQIFYLIYHKNRVQQKQIILEDMRGEVVEHLPCVHDVVGSTVQTSDWFSECWESLYDLLSSRPEKWSLQPTCCLSKETEYLWGNSEYNEVDILTVKLIKCPIYTPLGFFSVYLKHGA